MFVLAVAGISASAQNNVYSIDDECYALFLRTEAISGTTDEELFNQINDSLLHTALFKNNTTDI